MSGICANILTHYARRINQNAKSIGDDGRKFNIGGGKTKRIKAMILVLILSAMFSGCGNKITEGQIYEKEFVPAHTEIVLIPMAFPGGKTVKTRLMPQIRSYSDTWYIRIQSTEVDEDGKREKAEYSVTEEIFNQYEVGDFYSHEK